MTARADLGYHAIMAKPLRVLRVAASQAQPQEAERRGDQSVAKVGELFLEMGHA